MEYRTFKSYDPNVTREVSPAERVDSTFADTHKMIEYVQMKKPEILNDFIQAVEKRLKGQLCDFRFEEGFDFKDSKEKYPSVEQFPSLYELTLSFVYKHLGLEANHNVGDEKLTVLAIKSSGSVTVPRYLRIKAMIDVLGREKGIQLYKDYVSYRTSLPVDEKIKGKISEFREQAIKNWSGAKAMDFAVYVFDDHKHVCKFTNCLSYDALKHLDDHEVGYLTQCYPTTFMVEQMYETLGQRRRVTLFNHPYCDELYWDKSVHPNPEQPSLEFMDKIVIE
jgi:hypothetical protein